MPSGGSNEFSDRPMAPAAISIGSNLGDRNASVLSAIDKLDGLPKTSLVSRSSLFETEPVGLREQPWFVNAAALIETVLDARSLLDAMLEIERRAGRIRRADKGPRTLDLDLLLYGDSVIDEADLIVPHPHMAERKFVLEPLREIAPGLVHPVLGISIAELAAACRDKSEIRRLG